MRWLLLTAMMLSSVAACAQVSLQSTDEAPDPATASTESALPDAPSEVLTQQANVVVVGQASLKASGKAVETCGPKGAIGAIYIDPSKVDGLRKPCSELVYPYQRFLNTNVPIPLTWQKKGYLALHDVSDPANLATIAGIPAIAHQDPRYYRMPNAPIPKRFLYAVSRTFVSRRDDGTPIPNYGTLLAVPINAELSNLYVPSIQSDGASTAERIATGLAIDPVNNLLAEFLPDVARRVHVRIIFVQQILNNISSNQGSLP